MNQGPSAEIENVSVKYNKKDGKKSNVGGLEWSKPKVINECQEGTPLYRYLTLQTNIILNTLDGKD